MAEDAILNESVAWDETLDDSIGPDYGLETLRKSQLAVTKPAFGQPWSRTVGNGGHSGQFSWINRSRATIDKLIQFAEQYEDGFFTVIDHDGGGRHYVGNFVGDMPRSQAGNDRFNVQGWTFVEIPGCPMLEYPANWSTWAIIHKPFDDYGAPRCATSANWTRPAAVAGVQPNQLQNLAPTAGDSLTYEYRGYGFQLYAPTGPSYGLAQLTVDGVFVQAIDLYSAAAAAPAVVYSNASMPLDIHRVQLVLNATGNAASTGTGMVLDSFQVMR